METEDSSTFLRQEKDMFDMQKVGERIAALRRKADMTQADLAEWLGISYQAVSSWERGATMPDISKLVELSRALHTTVDALLSGEAPAEETNERMDCDDKTEDNAEEEPLKSFSGSLHDLMTRMNVKLDEQMQDVRENLQRMQIEVSGADVGCSEEAGKPVITVEKKNEHGVVTIYVNGDEKGTSHGRVHSDTIGALACYMDQETLEDELAHAIDEGDDDAVEEMACYLEPDTIDRAMERAHEPLTAEMMAELAMYMSQSALEECAVCALNADNADMLEEIICHMDARAIEQALERCEGELTPDMVETLACYASETALDLMIQKCDLKNTDVIEELAPYINQRQMRKLLQRLRND